MNSIERLQHYVKNTPQEVVEGGKVEETWWENGEIEIRDR